MVADNRPDHSQSADPSSVTQDRCVGNAKWIPESAFGTRWRTVLAEGVRTIPSFEQFLLTELRNSGPHYVCAGLTLADARKLSSEARIFLMNAMMHEKRGELLGRLCDGSAWPDSGLKVLAKLNTTECRRADYVRLGGYLRQPKTAKVLAHAQHLSPAILRAIWALPDWICLPNLLPILEKPEAVVAIKATFKAHLWDLSCELQRGVVKSLSRVKSLRELKSRLQAWRERLLSREQFPEPPIPGNDRLNPITSSAEMQHEAREMRSCLHKLIAEVLEGAVYFYSWNGSERATVLVVHSPGKLAHLEVKGRRNADVSPDTISEIRSLIEEQFFLASVSDPRHLIS
ncbi:MAG: hypothetical protein Q7S58_05495 [Candidatus Binatus sp.]|uniref:hypothetical protein n=1 Tax=Candidatus Binatus sp. TaxID=2811406 RepID=UPI00271B9087|nr:hypothetical protein [Candidatus Binatus sp.]MDO8431849.1 hypothetical protein [Candidatus Binatus sp.]